MNTWAGGRNVEGMYVCVPVYLLSIHNTYLIPTYSTCTQVGTYNVGRYGTTLLSIRSGFTSAHPSSTTSPSFSSSLFLLTGLSLTLSLALSIYHSFVAVISLEILPSRPFLPWSLIPSCLSSSFPLISSLFSHLNSLFLVLRVDFLPSLRFDPPPFPFPPSNDILF